MRQTVSSASDRTWSAIDPVCSATLWSPRAPPPDVSQVPGPWPHGAFALRNLRIAGCVCLLVRACLVCVRALLHTGVCVGLGVRWGIHRSLVRSSCMFP